MNRRDRLIFLLTALMFALSGCTALMFQVVSNKIFSYVFGVSAYAVATVLAAFMLGLALGSYVLGKLSTTRLKQRILAYGILEFLIGVYSLVFLPFSAAIEARVTAAARDYLWSLEALTAVRFVVAVLLIGGVAFLMGGSLPLLAEGLKARGQTHRINLLYGINVVGAALSVLISSYVLVPAFGLSGVLVGVFSINTFILGVSIFLEFGTRMNDAPVITPREDTVQRQATASAPVPRFVILAAFASGYVTFANEVIWNHVLSIVVGTSVYAYAIMLFTTLIGMAIGSFLVHRKVKDGHDVRNLIGVSQIALALATITLLPLWDDIPEFFLRTGLLATTFARMETIRFLACFSLIFLPAVISGTTLPLVFAWIERDGKSLGDRVGRIYAVNTAGTILGALITGFFVIGWLGGHNSLAMTAMLSLVTGIALLSKARTRLRLGAGAVAFSAAWLAMFPTWDPRGLLSGANIYFAKAHGDFDEVIWEHEDHVGGVTSVIRTGDELTLLTNGKFQGNDGKEIIDQARFAMIPNIFVKDTHRALNIGLGTGVTLGVIGHFPYREIDVVELSPDIITAARKYFAKVNAGVLERSDVKVHIEDGRNFLALNPTSRLYDLISIELTSIWFAGAGNLYNDEFYDMAKKSMAPGGVLQQWVQLHHISSRDIAVILKTLRKHFRYVQLWVPEHQGIIVASDEPLIVQPERMHDIQNGSMAQYVDLKEPWTMLGELVLTADGVDRFLAAAETTGRVKVSTDLNLELEYSTPKGNALGWNFDENQASLSPHMEADPTVILPEDLRRDVRIRALAAFGRAGFYPETSDERNEQIQAALSMLPTREERLAMRDLFLRAESATVSAR